MWLGHARWCVEGWPSHAPAHLQAHVTVCTELVRSRMLVGLGRSNELEFVRDAADRTTVPRDAKGRSMRTAVQVSVLVLLATALATLAGAQVT